MSFFKTLSGFTGGFQSVLKQMEFGLNRFTHRVELKTRKLIRKIFLDIFCFIFVMLSFVFIITGAILFLSRFFSLDIIFVAVGFLFLYTAVMFKLVK